MPKRTTWRTRALIRKDEPLLVSLLMYDQYLDRFVEEHGHHNLVSSLTDDGKQMPIIDLDADHFFLESSTDGHHHLYLNVPISRCRWWVLMWGLYVGKVIDKGFFWWSLRRGANFARVNSTKTPVEQGFKPTYGWLFKKRRYWKHFRRE